MNKPFKVLMIISVVILLFTASTPVIADWGGLETVLEKEDRWESITNIVKWNNKVIFSESSGFVWMMEYDDNLNFSIIDSLNFSNQNFKWFYVTSDTLYVHPRANGYPTYRNDIYKIVLDENGFSTTRVYEEEYNNDEIESICLINNSYFAVREYSRNLYKISFQNGQIIEDEVISEFLPYDGQYYFLKTFDGYLVASMYNDLSIYEITEDDYIFINSYAGERFVSTYPKVYNGKVYQGFVSEDSTYINLRKIDPFTNEVEAEIQVPYWNHYLTCQSYNECADPYMQLTLDNNHMVLINLDSFELMGTFDHRALKPFYALGNEMYLSRSNYSPEFVVHERTSDSILRERIRYNAGAWKPVAGISFDNIKYLATPYNGLWIVDDIGSGDPVVISKILKYKDLRGLTKNGDETYVFASEYYGIHHLDCQNPSQPVVLNSSSILGGYQPFDYVHNGETLIVSINNQVKLISSDLSEIYSTLETNGYSNIEVNGENLYVLSDSLSIFNISNPEYPQFEGTFSTGLENPQDMIFVNGKLIINQKYNLAGDFDGAFAVLLMGNQSLPLLVNIYREYENNEEIITNCIIPYNDSFLIRKGGRNTVIVSINEYQIIKEQDVGLWSEIGFSDGEYLYFHEGDKLVICKEYGVSGVNQELSTVPEILNVDIYPNPANAAPSVRFMLEKSSDVGFSLYNVLGQKIFWTSQVYPSGIHTYSLAGNMQNIASGTYYLGVEVGGKETVKKITILK